jgi:threonine dehydrogenase-like Zn-dependent dehydrogenase
MRGAILFAPGDVRCEERPDPVIMEPTDAIVRTVATCVCGSDLWPYRGIDHVTQTRAIGHEYCGIVEQVGDAVRRPTSRHTAVVDCHCFHLPWVRTRGRGSGRIWSSGP